MKIFNFYDRYLVAHDEADAISILSESYTARELKRELKKYPLVVVTGTIDLQSGDQSGPITRSYTIAEAVKACGRGLIPEGE